MTGGETDTTPVGEGCAARLQAPVDAAPGVGLVALAADGNTMPGGHGECVILESGIVGQFGDGYLTET